MDKSLAMCRAAAADGICAIVATSHRGNPQGNTTGTQVLKAVKKLKTALKKNKISIDILPGHKIRIDKNLINNIEKGLALTVNNNKKYILLELPFESVPFYVFDVLAQLKEKGITPIIAHPERNAQIQADKRVMKRMIKSGALSQITGGSLLGEFDPAARRSAVELLKGGLAHVIASDSHSADRPPVLSEAIAEAAKIVGQKKAKILVTDNPEKIVKKKERGCLALPSSTTNIKRIKKASRRARFGSY